MAEVQGERLRAEQEIGHAQPGGLLTGEQVRKLVESLKDIAAVLATADPKFKAEVYEELGISVTYDPTRYVVADRITTGESVGQGKCRRGDLNSLDTCAAS